MRELIELPAWERLLKKIVWAQLGNICEKSILDFGSGSRVIIMTVANSTVKSRVLKLLPKLKTRKIKNLCDV